jgi:hypothetical protein
MTVIAVLLRVADRFGERLHSGRCGGAVRRWDGRAATNFRMFSLRVVKIGLVASTLAPPGTTAATRLGNATEDRAASRAGDGRSEDPVHPVLEVVQL